MGQLNPNTSIITFYRESLKPADSLISPSGQNPFPAQDTVTIGIETGQWITKDTSGNAILATAGGYLVFPCWVGDRSDAGAALQITAIRGPHQAQTTVFDPTPATAYAPGVPLTVDGSSRLTSAGSGDIIVAVAEGAPVGANAQFPNGFLPYNTFNVGGKA